MQQWVLLYSLFFFLTLSMANLSNHGDVTDAISHHIHNILITMYNEQ